MGEGLQQWSAAPAEAHHRLSRRLFGEGGRLRVLVDAVDDAGSGLAPELEAERQAIANLPLDDSIAEKPHAAGKKTHDAAHGGKWAWMAATLRLEQNLRDFQLMARSEEELQEEDQRPGVDGQWNQNIMRA